MAVLARAVRRPLFPVLLTLLMTAVLWAAGCSDPEISAERPNILFITVDDMGRDAVGAYGSTIPDITPNIDRLAAEGLRFEHAHVSIALCQPSRASLMTGLHPHRNGAMGFEKIREEVPTLFERLADEGYWVGIMSKVGHTAPSRGAAWDAVVTERQLNGGRDPTLYYEHARRLLADAKQTARPFFLVANVDDPHFPFAGTREESVSARHGLRGMTGPPPASGRSYSADEITVPGSLPDLAGVREDLAAYYTSVHRADESFGQILRALEDEGLSGSTLVVLLSDNGTPFPFAKTNVYLSSTRTPWIVRWPGVVAAGAHDTRHVISAVDFAPTILEVAGLSPFKVRDGESILPLLRGEQQPERDHVFTFLYETIEENRFPMRAVQSARFGYIYNAWADGRTRFRNRVSTGRAMLAMREAARTDGQLAARLDFLDLRAPEELYDWTEDPDALHDLVASGAQQERIRQLRELLRFEMERSADPLLERFERHLDERARPIDHAVQHPGRDRGVRGGPDP